jgi:sulfatase modifying factor 1
VRHINSFESLWLLLLLSLAIRADATAIDTGINEFIAISGSTQFQSVLQGGESASVVVKAFSLQQHPVTNADYLQFVIAHPEWQRGKVAALFSNDEYLEQWQSSLDLGDQVLQQQPVTRVSWFAAQAYCESINARLPTWYEWELVAAASEQSKDARNDARWRQDILDWYSKPANGSLSAVMSNKPNFYGIYDLHGLIWEWVLDFNALMDNSEAQKFCGGGALNLQQKENFAVLMRVAMFSSLHATDTSRTVGFRCVRDSQ